MFSVPLNQQSELRPLLTSLHDDYIISLFTKPSHSFYIYNSLRNYYLEFHIKPVHFPSIGSYSKCILHAFSENLKCIGYVTVSKLDSIHTDIPTYIFQLIYSNTQICLRGEKDGVRFISNKGNLHTMNAL